MFTQDLAQDLDPELSAVDTVTSVVRQKDPTLSDERARSVLGALGLTGEKALRQIKFLSGTYTAARVRFRFTNFFLH